MATIYSRIDKNGNKRYYGSIYHNGKRTRKSLGCSKQSAKAVLKKLEYKLLFNIQSYDTKPHLSKYEKAILSFLKEVERTSVKVKQVSDIHTKLNYFKDYCFLIGIRELDAYVWKNIGDMTYTHQMSFFRQGTLFTIIFLCDVTNKIYQNGCWIIYY